MLYAPWPQAAALRVFVLPPYAAKPMRRERVSRVGGSAATGKRPEGAALDARATRALDCVAFQGGRTAALSRRPGSGPRACPPPPFPGHGKPSTAVASRSAESGKRPTPASQEERPLPRLGRDRAAGRQDAATPLWGTRRASAQRWQTPRTAGSMAGGPTRQRRAARTPQHQRSDARSRASARRSWCICFAEADRSGSPGHRDTEKG